MSDDATIILHGFLSLPHLEKLKLINAINDYFDSNEREPIRAEHDRRFAELDMAGNKIVCICCGRSA